jgi:thiol-disulfide isomerase/thioredoxin
MKKFVIFFCLFISNICSGQNQDELIKMINRGLDSLNIARRPVLYNSDSLSKSVSYDYQLVKERQQSLYYMKLAFFSIYQKKLPPRIIDSLRAEFKIGMLNEDLESIRFSVTSNQKERLIYFIQKYKENYGDKPKGDEKLISLSGNYRSFLIKRLWALDVMDSWVESLVSGDISINILNMPFDKLYSMVQNNYDGYSKDLLLTEMFKLYNGKGSFSVAPADYISKAMNDIKDQRLKDEISRMVTLPGMAFDNILFHDSIGKKVPLSSFRGKVVVIDTWSKDCIPCAYLSRAMRQVEKNYDNNSNVVFIELSTDVKREEYIQGLKTGLYRTEKSLNYWIGELGHKHPTIEKYGIIGTPRQIIIDKEGKLVAIDPKRPKENKPDTHSEIMDLINRALLK